MIGKGYLDGTLIGSGMRFKRFIGLLVQSNVRFELQVNQYIRSKRLELHPIEVVAMRKGLKVTRKYDRRLTERLWMCAEFIQLEMWTAIDIMTATDYRMHTLDKRKQEVNKAPRYRKLMLKYLELD